MRELRRMIARLESIADAMDDIIRDEAKAPAFTPWRGREAEDRAERRQNRITNFQLLVNEGAAISKEALRLLKSEGVDTRSPELDELEQKMEHHTSFQEMAHYARTVVATLRAKSYRID